MEVASLYAKVSANAGSYERTMRGVRDDLEQTEGMFSRLGNLGEKAFKTIAIGAAAAGAAVVGTIAKSVNAAGSIEQQAANISAVFGDIAPPIQEVKDQINALALDPKLVVGVEDAGAGLEMLAKNGIAWDDIMQGVGRSTILLSNATGADLATAADIATNAMGIFGLKVEDMDSIVATFTNAANKSQFGVEDWGYALANAGPKANAMGWELDQLYAAMTLTSSGFASGQTMGTSWAWMIDGLTPKTDKATTAMKELGLMNEAGANAFFNADGSGKSLVESIGLLQEAFGGLTAEQQMAYSETLFGSEAFGALSGVLGMNKDALTELIPQMTDFSAVEEGAATRTNTYQAAMAALGDTFNSVFAMIGDKFLPVFTKLARGLAGFVKDNAQPIVDFFGAFATRTGSALEGITAALGTFRSRFSLQLATITSDTSAWGEKVSAVWYMVASVGNDLWQTMIANLLNALPTWMAALGEWAQAAWRWLIDAIPGAVQKLGEWAGALWRWIVDNAPTWAANLWEWAKATWQWIVEVTPIALTKLGEWFTALTAYLGANLPGWINTLLGWATALWTWIGNALPNAINALASFLALLRGEGDGATGGFWAMVGEWAKALWRWIVDVALPQIAPAFATFVQAVMTAGGNILSALGNLALELGKTLWWWITEVIPDVLVALGQFGAAIWGWLVENGPSWIGTLDTWGRAAWQWIANAIGPVAEWLGKMAAEFISWKDVVIGSVIALGILFWPVISAAFTAVVSGISAFVAAWAPILALFAAAIAAVSLVRNAWERDWGGIRTFTLEALKVVGDAFAPLFAIILEFGGDAIKEIWAWATGNKTAFTATEKIWESAKNAFGTVFTAIGKILTEWGTLAWNWFKEKFPGAAEAVIAAINKIKANFDEFWNAVRPLIQKFKDEFERYRENFEKNSGKVGEALQSLQRIMDSVWTIMVTAASLAINNLINVLTLFVQMIDGDWAGAWETIKQIGKSTWDTVVTIVTEAIEIILAAFGVSIDDFWRWYDEVIAAITDFVTGAQEGFAMFFGWVIERWNRFRDSIKQIMQLFKADVIDPIIAIRDYVAAWGEWFVQLFTNIFNAVKTKVTEWKMAAVDAVKGFVIATKETIDGWREWIVQKFVAIRDAIIQKFVDIRDGIKNKVNEFVNTGRDIVEGLWNGLREKWDSLVNWFTGVWGSLVDRFKNFFGIASPSTLFRGYGQNLMEGLRDGIDAAAQLPVSAMSALATNVQGKVTGMVNAVKNSAETIKNTINSMPALPQGYWSTPAAPTPTTPTPTVPTVPTTPAPVDDRGNIPSAGVQFGYKDLGFGLSLISGVTNVADTISDIQAFAGKARAFLTAPGQPQMQGSSAEALALKALQSEGVDSLSVNNLLSMIQALIRKLDERGFGNKFDINMAPDASLGQQQELEALVAYLNGLYA